MMEGGRGLEAEPARTRIERCERCDGTGVIRVRIGTNLRTRECVECDGYGEIYTGPSGEPEDYLGDEDGD